MKKLLSVLFLAVICMQVAGQDIVKETYTYLNSGRKQLKLDKYEIPSADVKPCLIFMFGGGFVGGTRDNPEYVPFFEFMCRKGYTVVSIDYRLGMKSLAQRKNPSGLDFILTLFKTVNDAARDLFRATRFVLRNAEEWRIDPDMIVTCGSSAGAVSVLQAEYMICERKGSAKRLLPRGFNYAGVISFAGAVLTMDPDLTIREAPCPILMFHGDADSNVPYDKLEEMGGGFYGSKYIAGKLRATSYPYVFYTFKNAAHEIATTPMNENRAELLRFLDDVVKNKRPLQINETIDNGLPARNKNFKLEDYIKSNF